MNFNELKFGISVRLREPGLKPDRSGSKAMAAQQQNSAESRQVRVRILSLGDTKTGKTAVIKRCSIGATKKPGFVKSYIPTVGVDYGVKTMTKEAKDGREMDVKVDFFDLSGEIQQT